jgi:flagellar assembly protein FliH
LSNLIKAYSVKYEENTKTIDSNEKAEAFEKEFVDKYIADNIALKQIDFGEVAKGLEDHAREEGDGFIPGIAGEVLVEDDTDPREAGIGSRIEELNEELSAKLDEVKEQEDRLKALKAEADQILSEAQERADSIVALAKKQAQDDSSLIREAARTEGYDDGMQAAQAEIDARSRELDERSAELESQYKKQVSELEPAFVEIVISLVEKLTGIYASEKEGIISYLVESAFEDIPRSNEYIVRVPESFHDGVEGLKARLEEAVGEEARVEIVEDKLLPVDGAMIETDSRIFDCSLSTMKDTLFENLRLLALSHSRSDGEGQ